MQCPVCGCEELRAVGNVKRGAKRDVRTRECTDCGMLFTTFETAPYLKLNGQNVAWDELKRLKIADELQDKYIENKKRRIKTDVQELF